MGRCVISIASFMALLHGACKLHAQSDALQLDPAAEFNNLTQGRPLWIRAEIRQPWKLEYFDSMARDLGIKSGSITKDQFVKHLMALNTGDAVAGRLPGQLQIHVNEAMPPDLERWNDPVPGDDGGYSRITAKPKRTRLRLPEWLAAYDVNGDGQVGLHEWRNSKRPLNEFATFDRNNDGLITPEEAQRSERLSDNGRSRSR